VDTNNYLWNCLVYIDLNMVRARVVTHPRGWRYGGYNGIQHPRSRHRVVHLEQLADLTGCSTVRELQATHREQVETALLDGDNARDPRWTEAIAVGSGTFVETIRSRLGFSRLQRIRQSEEEGSVLRETKGRYHAENPCRISI
jgi:putative transposase